MNLSVFILMPILMLICAFFFRKKQNSPGAVGGDISIPKSMWLFYTIITWFIFPIIFLIWQIDAGMKYVYIFHLASFWTRGLLELVMIYKWFNWSPRYGISHDFFHLVGLIVLFKIFWPLEISRPTLVSMIFIYSLIISLIFEIIFAFWFLKIRGLKNHLIYFASNAPQWRNVNRLTAVAVIIGYVLHILNIWVVFDLAL